LAHGSRRHIEQISHAVIRALKRTLLHLIAIRALPEATLRLGVANLDHLGSALFAFHVFGSLAERIASFNNFNVQLSPSARWPFCLSVALIARFSLLTSLSRLLQFGHPVFVMSLPPI